MEEKNNLCNTLLALIAIVEDSVPIVKYLETKGNNTPIKDIIASLSIKEIISLWDILKVSKYIKNPSSIVKQLNIDIKNYYNYVRTNNK